MNKKYCVLLLASSLAAGCSATKQPGSSIGEQSAQKETVIPVEQVWPEVAQPRANKAAMPTKVTVKNVPNRQRQVSNTSRRVVQVATNQPRVGVVHSNIQEGLTQGVHNITSMYGENHEVPVSFSYPSLIITPFASPDIKGDFEKRPVDYEVSGSNIIIIPKKNQRAWIMVYDKANPRGIPISLTLQPKAGMKSQTYNVTVGRLSPSENSNGLDSGNGSFAQELASVLHDIARLRIPTGYTVRPLKEKLVMENGMGTMPVERYSGRFDVYRYRISNSTGTVQELAEEMFGRNKNVRAVAFYPKKVLYPGEVTDVLIMTSKNGGMK